MLWLYILTEYRYTPLGIMVPALPPKKRVTALVNSHAESIFVKERTRGLTLFCEAIGRSITFFILTTLSYFKKSLILVSNPFLRHDNTWKTFMKPNANIKSESDYENNAGEIYLMAALNHLV